MNLSVLYIANSFFFWWLSPSANRKRDTHNKRRYQYSNVMLWRVACRENMHLEWFHVALSAVTQFPTWSHHKAILLSFAAHSWIVFRAVNAVIEWTRPVESILLFVIVFRPTKRHGEAHPFKWRIPFDGSELIMNWVNLLKMPLERGAMNERGGCRRLSDRCVWTSQNRRDSTATTLLDSSQDRRTAKRRGVVSGLYTFIHQVIIRMDVEEKEGKRGGGLGGPSAAEDVIQSF